jgi:hypothetical protein
MAEAAGDLAQVDSALALLGNEVGGSKPAAKMAQFLAAGDRCRVGRPQTA